MPDGALKRRQLRDWLYTIPSGGSTLGANVERVDPGAGGGGNAVVQQQHGDRNDRSKIAALSTVEDGSQLYRTLSAPVFTCGADIYEYLGVPGVVYLQPTQDEAQEHIRKVSAMTVRDLPVDQQDENQCLRFKAAIQGHNPLLHPNMNINNAAMITIFCNGLHPEAKVIALQMRSNLALAAQNNCCFSNQYPVGHPQAGVGHPNAGQLSLDALALFVHQDFTTKLRAGLFRLKGQPGINLASASPETQDATSSSSSIGKLTPEIAFASVDDVLKAGYDNFREYVYFALNRTSTSLRTCKNCGGVNHYSHKDGVFVCPTPEGSVSTQLLRQIKYPFSIRPWRFGKGKSKGGGVAKGRGGRGRGNGRGQYSTDDLSLLQEDQTSEHEHDDGTDDGLHITDEDYDGWNTWE